MANQFDADPAGVGFSQDGDVLNEDGSVDRTAVFKGVPLHYDFAGATDTALTCDITYVFHIPNTVDVTNIPQDAPFKYGLTTGYNHGCYAGEWSKPAWA